MKIGIIIHSKTGNTFSVAEKIQENLLSKGHEVDLIRLKTIKQGNTEKFESIPDISGYEGFVFGSLVEAFSLPAVMKKYMENLSDVSGKKVGIIVTQHFKYRWMGGNHTVKQMEKILRSKNSRIMGNFVINWSSTKKDEQIKDCAEKIGMGF